MIVVICGSRGWTDPAPIAGYLDSLVAAHTVIVHGGAKGADTLAGKLAEDRGIHCAVVKPLWGFFPGRSAGHARNGAMLLLNPDRVVAFSLGTPGTQGTIDRARRSGVHVTVFGREAS